MVRGHKMVGLADWVAGVGDDVWVFCDGAAVNSGFHGGWGYLVGSNGLRYSDAGGLVGTTSMRAEMTAVVLALQVIPGTGRRVVVHTDCKPIVQMAERLEALATQHWVTVADRPKVEVFGPRLLRDRDLWALILEATRRHSIRFQWVRGHNGDSRNEAAHRLATGGLSVAAKREAGSKFRLRDALLLARDLDRGLPWKRKTPTTFR